MTYSLKNKIRISFVSFNVLNKTLCQLLCFLFKFENINLPPDTCISCQYHKERYDSKAFPMRDNLTLIGASLSARPFEYHNNCNHFLEELNAKDLILHANNHVHKFTLMSYLSALKIPYI